MFSKTTIFIRIECKQNARGQQLLDPRLYLGPDVFYRYGTGTYVINVPTCYLLEASTQVYDVGTKQDISKEAKRFSK